MSEPAWPRTAGAARHVIASWVCKAANPVEAAHHVDVLEAVVPLAWQTGFKSKGGEGTEHVLIQSLVIAVHVVADLQG